MNKITQDMQFRQSLLKYASKYGVTKAAIRYKVNRQYVYRWQRRYDGTWESLKDRPHKPHSHPNQHTEAELKLIRDMRRRYRIGLCPKMKYPPTGFVKYASSIMVAFVCPVRN